MEKLFKLQERGTTVRTEVVAGITTFLTMAYILAVNPGMLGETGMSAGGVFTATALSAAIATLVMAVAANLPVGLAPGMGLNAFFRLPGIALMMASRTLKKESTINRIPSRNTAVNATCQL